MATYNLWLDFYGRLICYAMLSRYNKHDKLFKLLLNMSFNEVEPKLTQYDSKTTCKTQSLQNSVTNLIWTTGHLNSINMLWRGRESLFLIGLS